MFKFNLKYFLCFLLLFVIEVFIERYTHEAIIRPFFGDFLVVILIYCFIKSLLKTSLYYTAIGVLLFSYFIEFMQYLHWVDLLGLGYSYIAKVILGTYFAWLDLLMYTLGILLVIIIEKLKLRIQNQIQRSVHHKSQVFFV
ncbi:MAG: DUF2809 domain-containing protein [Bacteroidetes bacterium]|nr:DUF2809 domain-containing protein [Bacteroidota bacterium]MBU1373869.1 DUF2809 domain-containing protein [Bacteroidota bacterium]MBU1483976.1 DUF2809 domain-containing protein [Bacteroidota bacterium]MBU1760018.1 DUF2809 domain-containing protein [Bacteroidota bacterium]MBU2268169.1 DUF2809 domain-containing protein [Bacteroidota bacterium]